MSVYHPYSITMFKKNNMKFPAYPKIILAGFVILFVAGFSYASVQFEGILEINRYSVSENGDEKLKDNFRLSLSPDRILFSGDGKSLDMMGAIEANSIIIRHDVEDFVFLGNSSEAVVLRKQELLSMINLMKNVKDMNRNNNDRQVTTPVPEFIQTPETKRINGFSTRKWLMESENSTEVFHVWLTEEININWGLLSEPWLTNLTLFSDLPFAEWMREGKSPIQVERYENELLTDRISIENIEEKRHPRNHFDIPAGTEVINFQQLLMKRMSGM